MKVKVAIPQGSTAEILETVQQAKALHDLEFHVFDSRENIDQQNNWIFHQVQNPHEAVVEAVSFVASGEAQILMKGIVQTHDLLKEVLQKKYELREQKILSHVAIAKFETRKSLLITDGAMNIQPNRETLISIVNNGIKVAQKMGIKEPEVALLSAAENLNPKMPSSVLMDEVTQVFAKSTDYHVFGPLSLDLAVSKESVQRKNYQGPIAGSADLLVVPTIDVGNVLYKSLMLFSKAVLGGIIVGSRVPIALTSRSDDVKSKLAALELALTQV